MELFTSALEDQVACHMEDPVQPSHNPSVLRTTHEDAEGAVPEGKGAVMIQKAVSEAGNSSDSFVSIDSQDMSQ